MNKQAVGFLAVVFMWRRYIRQDTYDALLDGAYLLAEALGTGHEELAEAIRIANKYYHALYNRAYWKNLRRREVWEEAVQIVEEELGITLQMPGGEGRWNA